MTYTDDEFILELATSSASLDRSPKHNWVEDAGGLPPYVRKLARAIAKNGHDLSSAIAIAISRVKVWAAGGGNVNADTRAKAVKALAQWEAAKAKSHVKLSRADGSEYIFLAATENSYNIEIVRAAWESIERERRNFYRAAHGSDEDYPYRWVSELGNDYIIVQIDTRTGRDYVKYDYAVDAQDHVSFSNPRKAEQVWVEMDDDDLPLTLSEKRGLGLISIPGETTPLERVAAAAQKK